MTFVLRYMTVSDALL